MFKLLSIILPEIFVEMIHDITIRSAEANFSGTKCSKIIVVSEGAWIKKIVCHLSMITIPHCTTPHMTFKQLTSVKYDFCYSLPVVNIQKFGRK
jgi:hypothetical protein